MDIARNGGRSRTAIASAMNVEPQTRYTVTRASQTRTPCRAAIRRDHCTGARHQLKSTLAARRSASLMLIADAARSHATDCATTTAGPVRIGRSCRASSPRHPGACHAAGRIWPSSSSSGWASTSRTRSHAARPTAASRTRSRTASGSCAKENGLGALFEPAVQRVVDTSSILVTLTSYTYWLSQFAVVGATLLWVYFRHHERFAGFRNWLIAANLVGLVGYVLDADRTAADVPRVGLRRHARPVLVDQPRQRPHRVRRQPVRRDAEPALDGCADRRRS